MKLNEKSKFSKQKKSKKKSKKTQHSKKSTFQNNLKRSKDHQKNKFFTFFRIHNIFFGVFAYFPNKRKNKLKKAKILKPLNNRLRITKFFRVLIGQSKKSWKLHYQLFLACLIIQGNHKQYRKKILFLLGCAVFGLKMRLLNIFGF